MQEFETQEHDSEVDGGSEDASEKGKNLMRYLLKRFILIISFGPGILGFLWLLGKIIRR
ncbi:MAG TPA: hypothetical protein PKN86_04605 [Candidatus Obscuribacter sp.]|jgi:hypothetical protein|nr:hypothetical protein [Candidatus Obscuribacter sp.]MBK9278253.1 hypothetical protein [Candidatus Obscuribacter sp.]MBL8081137.1 hypothetical protein [Candidatus Obscuribacter sp.]MDX1987407.1 hypothetical protein [Candidatus Obscuribacter sp.]HMW90219.1 hypothetical protein [Candidatus Obscuribacter sp.]